MPDSINCSSFNARGITTQAKQYELREYIIKNKLEIINLQETFLKDKVKFSMPGYSIIRSDRTSFGGGLAILIKKNIPFEVLQVVSNDDIEYITIKILIFSNVYIPRYSARAINQLKSKILSFNNNLIAGDLNAIHNSWSAGTENVTGKKFFDLMPFNNHVINICTGLADSYRHTQ